MTNIMRVTSGQGHSWDMMWATVATGTGAASAWPAAVVVGFFLALGLAAGILTTVAGQGGGLLMLLACSALVGPHEALAITTPALLLGNLHRAVLLRTEIDRPVATRMIIGVLPGALVGGLLAGVIPPWSLRVVLVAITALAIAKAVGLLSFRVRRSVLVPAGFLVGGATGTAGGAGVLFAPVLLSAGLSGRAYVATSAAAALAAHAGRMAGYASFGLFTRDLIGATVVVSLAIFAGNALGDRVRSLLLAEEREPGEAEPRPRTAPSWWRTLPPAARTKLIEYGTLVVCVVLSVAGLG